MLLEKEEANTLDTVDISHEFELLGMLIRDNTVLYQLNDVQKKHFYAEINGIIFETAVDLINRGSIADITSIMAHIPGNVQPMLEEIGGISYIRSIATTATLATPGDRARLIRSVYQKRMLTDICKQYLFDAHNATPQEVPIIIDSLQGALYQLTQNISTKEPQHVYKYVEIALNQCENIVLNKVVAGEPTGYKQLDNVTGGLQKSDLIVLAARTSMGKTAFALNLAYNIAKNHINTQNNVLFFSLEMSSKQIATRITSLHTGINGRIINSGKDTMGSISLDKIKDIQGKCLDMQNLPILVDDSAYISVSTIRSKIMSTSRKHKINVVIIDYLQLIKTDTKLFGNRVQEIAKVTQELKTLAKDIDIPIILLSQLSRAVETRESKKPQLSDLRDSGAIEQDADIVAFLYRPAYYDKERIPIDKEEAELIIAKHRNGATGIIKLEFQRSSGIFI